MGGVWKRKYGNFPLKKGKSNQIWNQKTGGWLLHVNQTGVAAQGGINCQNLGKKNCDFYEIAKKSGLILTLISPLKRGKTDEELLWQEFVGKICAKSLNTQNAEVLLQCLNVDMLLYSIYFQSIQVW